MNNIVENVIATIVVIALSTAVELILQFFGLDAQKSITIAGIVLFTLAILFMIFRKYYPAYIRWLTKRLLKNALQLNTNEADTSKITFKKEIIAQVHLENSEAELTRSSLVTVFSSQEECEPYMREAFRTAKTIKILTIRGEKYFLGSRSLFYKLYLLKQKQAKNFTIQVLVLLPEAEHITEKLAEELGQYSAEEIRDKMHNVLKILSNLDDQKSFQVRCYNETPNLKMLIFDNIMFVTAFTEPKNDQNAKMFQLTRSGNPLFIGLERHFDDLWKRSASP